MPGRLTPTARLLFHRAGGLHLARWLNRNSFRILMYHRFPDARGLEAQCRHLRDYYRPLSLTTAADHLKARQPLPRNSVIVTVDDGHRDFFEIAYPIFSSYGIPVTVYVVTDFLDRQLWLWADQVRYAFAHTGLRQVRVDPGDGEWRQFDLQTDEQKKSAAREIGDALKLVPNEKRLMALERLPDWLQVQIPEQAPGGCEPLAWEEVRLMAGNGVEFGAHTRTHPVLSRLSSPAELAAEIGGSKQRIEEALGRPVRHFCYPNGSERDISTAAVEAVRQAGFDTAVTTTLGVNAVEDDRFLLRRIGVDPRYAPDYFARCAAAFHVR
jgi:peptidoglycan/xylan/chitin deacetylase (PgdA/CDA1 family)